MGTNRHSNTRAQPHILTKGMQQQQQQNKTKGEEILRVRRKTRELRKVAKKMSKAESGEDSRAKGTSQIDTEKLMRNCKEGCV